jgi:hypothetical protein
MRMRYHPTRRGHGPGVVVRVAGLAEAAMSENGVEKDFGPVDRFKEASGIYGLGFERESFLGFMLPFAFVVIVGGIGALIIFWL